MPRLSRENVVVAIQNAFRGVSRNNGVTLHEAFVIDDRGSAEERAIARLKDMEQSWEDVPAQILEQACSALCFIDTEGFRYYIPALMIWTLRNYELSNAYTIDSTIYALDPGDEELVIAQRQANFNSLDSEQRTACALFLEFMSDETFEPYADSEFALRTLNRYWAQYLPA